MPDPEATATIPRWPTPSAASLKADAALRERVAPGKEKLKTDPKTPPPGWKLDTSHMRACTSCFEEAYRRSIRVPLRAVPGVPVVFLDDHAVARADGVVRVMQRPTKQRTNIRCPGHCDGGDALATKHQQQNHFGMYGSVVREGSIYRIWLGEWEPYYAESTDGLRWSKLRLLRSLSPHGWSPRNLCVMRDGERAHADHAFKLGYHCGNYKSTESTCVASSADGIAWTPWGGGKRANAEARCDQLRQCCGPGCASAADTYNCMYRRAADGAHLLINRRNYGTKRAWREIRGVRLSANRHLWHNFTGFGVVSEWYLDRLGKDERYQRQVYSLSVAPLHAEPPAGIAGVRAEGAQIYMGLLTLIEWAKIGSLAKKRAAPPFSRDVMSVYLITSRDGVHFDLSSVYAHNPLLPRGACAVDKQRRQPWPAAVAHAVARARGMGRARVRVRSRVHAACVVAGLSARRPPHAVLRGSARAA